MKKVENSNRVIKRAKSVKEKEMNMDIIVLNVNLIICLDLAQIQKMIALQNRHIIILQLMDK